MKIISNKPAHWSSDYFKLLLSSQYPRHVSARIIEMIYISKPLDIYLIVAFLKRLLKESNVPKARDLAALGADALYEQMEKEELLDTPETLFLLRSLLEELASTLETNNYASLLTTSKATVFRVFGLMKACHVAKESIFERWIQTLRCGGFPWDCWDATKKYPGEVDVARLVCEGYSKRIGDAVKMAEFIESLRPNFQLVMIGFKELLVQMCDLNNDEEDQADAHVFMDVVQRFKEVSEDCRGQVDEAEVERVKEAIPGKIRNLIFPPSGYCVMYNVGSEGFVENDASVSILSKEVNQNCRLQISSLRKLGYGTLFKIVDLRGNGLQPRYRWSVLGSKYFSKSSESRGTYCNVYKIRPCERGASFTIVKVESRSVLMAAEDIMGIGYVNCKNCCNLFETGLEEPEMMWKIVDYEDLDDIQRENKL